MKLGYYPGCSLTGSAREYGESLTAVTGVLGIELSEVPDWNCCGATAAHALTHALALALPARVLALAEQAGLDELLVPCSACYARLSATQRELLADENLRTRIEEIIELPWTGRTQVLTVLQVLSRFLTNGIKEKVTHPIGHKVACYYGCYLTRPTKSSSCARHEDPQEMDDLVRSVGAEPIDWAFKVECCGAGLSVSRTSSVAELSGRIIEDAVNRGAEAIVVACPMCHSNFDLRRAAIERHRGAHYEIPVLYITELIGMAMGIDREPLGISRHFVPLRWGERDMDSVEAVGVGAAPSAAGRH